MVREGGLGFIGIHEFKEKEFKFNLNIKRVYANERKSFLHLNPTPK